MSLSSSFASFASSLPVVGAVRSVDARARASSALSLLSSLRGARSSDVVGVVSVVRGVDRVSVVCSDGRTRVCRVSFASKALGRAVSVDAVFARMSARVGQHVCFFAADGWSPDQWFVGCVPAADPANRLGRG